VNGSTKNRSLRIRAARADDYFACLPLLTSLYHGDIGTNFKQTFESFVLEKDSTVVLAEHPNKVIGILIGSCYLDVDWEGKVAKIDALIIDEAFRRMGIGRRLFECFVSWARERRCKAIRSRVNKKNKTAQSFHQNLGFTRAQTYEYILELREQHRR